MQEEIEIKLTQFSRGAGCGCKIAPAVLEEILAVNNAATPFSQLLVGNDTRDDAAVYDLGNGSAVISTADFFMPIVDDAYDFGRIASANSISDIYAMGGKPLMAIAILGWPVSTLPAALAGKVLAGARAICEEAGIPLAGGHSIDSTEPIFGLSVTGTLAVENLKRNNTAQKGDLLFLTKPIGTGILSTAQKRGVINPSHLSVATASMVSLNKIGEELGAIKQVTSMTDITGFGLAGHLIEMMEGASLTAEISYSSIPVLDGAREYLSQRIIPDATYRNWNGYGKKVEFKQGVNVMEAFSLLPDPQTNGGLLFTAPDSLRETIASLLEKHNLYSEPIGRVVEKGEKAVMVVP